ncbi:hypothetical protein GALL_119090 [mine drainage metagenome]|uniref:Uncharacterized protein n=1 Tax=mine drainage metagenome TaxID=410659 RepID=A0A1J5SQ18_9ZZZZ
MGVADGVLNIPVPQVVLYCARVLPILGQFVTAGMAQHVRMNRKWQICLPARPGKYLANSICRKGRFTLATKDKAKPGIITLQPA